MNHRREAGIRSTLRVLARITGSSVGFLVGVYVAIFAIGWGMQLIPSLRVEAGNDARAFFLGLFFLLPVSLLTGGPLGAAVGATVVQKVLRQRSSFWKALLGTVAGLLVGVTPTALCLWTLYEQGVWHDRLWPFLAAIAVVCATVVAGGVIGSGWKAKPAAEAQR